MAEEGSPTTRNGLGVAQDGSLERMSDALGRIAGVLPPGLELLLAVLDAQREAGDLLLRDAQGATSVLLGLSRGQHAQIGALLESMGSPRARGPALRPHEPPGLIAEMQRANERLARENRQLVEFARVTAHDLMAPVRALSGLVDLLAPTVSEPGQDTLTAIQSSLMRMMAMVDSAVGFAGSHAPDPASTSVDLNRVVAQASETLAADIVGCDAHLRVGPLPTVRGNAAQLERVFVSLLSNALSYSGNGAPQIDIFAAWAGTMWQITVADAGIGVPQQARQSIFDLFAREVAISPRAGAGRGIGLATCRQIVESHGGQIWVQDNHPRGAAFVFSLPAG
jgi:signal transduction histidine kinase